MTSTMQSFETTQDRQVQHNDRHSEVIQQIKSEGLDLLTNLLKPSDSVTKTVPTTTVGKFFEQLWLDLEAKNTLKKSFFVSDRVLAAFRWFTLIMNIITFFWLLSRPENIFGYMTIPSYLTNWGFFVCFAYSILVVLWNGAPDDSAKWRFAYVLGELGFAMEMMICPFYFAVIFPGDYPTMSTSELIYNILIHFIVPLMIWVEVLFNDISFPPGHRFIIHMIVGTYLLNNALWTYFNEPVYGPIDWVSKKSYILTVGGALAVIGGFSLGGFVYRWKKYKSLRVKNL